MIVGYTTVSISEQNAGLVARELFRSFDFGRLVTDVVSHRGSHRPNLEPLLGDLDASDTLVIPELSRLHEDIRKILETMDDLYCRRIRLISLSEGFDTHSSGSAITFRVLMSLLRIKPSIIAADPKERRGKRTHKFGRSPALSEFDIKDIQLMASQGVSIQELMVSFGCSRRTIKRALNGNHTSLLLNASPDTASQSFAIVLPTTF